LAHRPLPLTPLDVNECKPGAGNDCHPDATCEDSEGGFKCACKDGFIGDGKSCGGEQPLGCAGGAGRGAARAQFQKPPSLHRALAPASQNPCSIPPPDINECEATDAHKHKCDPDHAVCTNTHGNYTCACRAEDGFTGDGYSCADTRAPTITLGALVVSATAPANAGKAKAAFPGWTLSDNLSAKEKITVACTANLTKGSDAEPVDADKTEFFVGTTAVACVATDEAKNPSPPAVFSVVVGCATGTELRAGVCTGEACGERKGRGRAPAPLPTICCSSAAQKPLSPAPSPPPADNVAPILTLTSSRVPAYAVRDANTVTVTAFPHMTATDPQPVGEPAPLDVKKDVKCNATIDGTSVEVTPATAFPYGVTIVACVARDAAGNPSEPAAFTVEVACEPGSSMRADSGLCKGEGMLTLSEDSPRLLVSLHYSPKAAPRLLTISSPPSLSTLSPRPRPDNDECVLGGGNVCSPNADCFNDPKAGYSCKCKTGYQDAQGSTVQGTQCEGE
jgi:hypothetical protein